MSSVIPLVVKYGVILVAIYCIIFDVLEVDIVNIQRRSSFSTSEKKGTNNIVIDKESITYKPHFQTIDTAYRDYDDSYQQQQGINNSHKIIYASTNQNNIAPGELPGYTGWARPETTLARFFSIESISTESPQLGEEFVITIRCEGHEDCYEGSSLFFLRAYGPSVVPGTVRHHSVDDNDLYDITFVFYDPGLYTVEVVLTFSNPPPISAFPLSQESDQPAYEGFLLPGFPLFVQTQENNTSINDKHENHINNELCKFDDLIETSKTSAINKARWKVTGRSNGRGYSSKNSPMDMHGYITNRNSLGIQMEYRYLSGCDLLSEAVFDTNITMNDNQPNNTNLFSQCPRKIQVLYIGDSVLRVQMDKLKSLAGTTTSNIEFRFLSLHLGYRRNQILGPSNVQRFLDQVRQNNPNDTIVILFNTGLHDIHQLCGAENGNDRHQYLNRSIPDSDFSCLDEYRLILDEFVNIIQNYSAADLKIFQSSTAAWPKYGNWNIEWNYYPQRMPLASDFVSAFNDVAFDVLSQKNGTINIMDGYWITYSRPDNREYGSVGKKLSHPGDEVLSAMSRIWAKMILDKVCNSEYEDE